MSSPVWITRTAHKIKVRDMTDSHLFNTIKMLERQAPSLHAKQCLIIYGWANTLNGEMAQTVAEQEIDSFTKQDPLGYFKKEFPIYNSLLREAKRRKLKL